jgi:hypothetical protein
MNIGTTRLTRAELEALPVMPCGGFERGRYRYQSASGQWIFVAPGECAVIEVADEVKQRRPETKALAEVETGLFAR